VSSSRWRPKQKAPVSRGGAKVNRVTQRVQFAFPHHVKFDAIRFLDLASLRGSLHNPRQVLDFGLGSSRRGLARYRNEHNHDDDDRDQRELEDE
jgi:hypothetical protein